MLFAERRVPRGQNREEEAGWWYGWIVLLSCTFAKALKSFGQNNTLFLSIPGIEHDVGLSHTAVGSLMCLACLASAVTQPFAGRFQDRFGGRLTIPAALVLLAVFLWIVASAHSAGQVLFGFVGLRTFGLGALDTFTAACVNQWFVKTRGTALSLMTIGFFVGTGAGTVQVLALVKRHSDWRSALAVGGVICTVSAPICALLIRSTPEGCGLLPDPPSQRNAEQAPQGQAESNGSTESPQDGSSAAHVLRQSGGQGGEGHEEAGPSPVSDGDGGAERSFGRDGSECGVTSGADSVARVEPCVGGARAPSLSQGGGGPGPPAEAISPVIEGVTLREATRALAFWLLGVFTFGFFFQASGTDFHLVGMVAEAGSVDVASTLSLGNAMSSAVSSLAVGYALDRRWVSARIVLLFSSFLLMAYTLLLTLLTASWLGVVTGFIKGTADACSNIGVPFAVAGIFGRAHNGEIFSMNRSLGVVASGLGPLMFGFARDRLGLYRSTLRSSIIVPAMMGLAAVLMPWHGKPFSPREAWTDIVDASSRGKAAVFRRTGGGARPGVQEVGYHELVPMMDETPHGESGGR